MQEILLNKGFISFIDDEDYPIVARYNWHVKRHDNCIYAATTVGTKKKRITLRMHRLILPNYPRIDHKDGNGLNNQKDNLRKSSGSQNSQNSRKHKIGQSKYKGINKIQNSDKWIARIGLNRKRIYLGYFDSEVEAAKAYDIAAKEYFGEFARTNFESSKTSDDSFVNRERITFTTSLD